MSVVIARSFDSRMARPNPSSCSARTPVALHGLSFSEDNTRRVSLRYDIFYNLVLAEESLMEGMESTNEGQKLIKLSIHRKLPRSDRAAQ